MRLLPAILLLAPGPSADGIDAILARRWEETGVRAAPLAGDAEFLRRLSLDLLGRVPTLAELEAFRKNPDRAAKIEEMLAGSEFPRFWSEVWTAWLNGYAPAFESSRDALRLWLEKQIRANAPWDRIASELISASGVSNADGAVNFILHNSFEPAIKVSRAFLGIRLDCARCHDHPFDRWTQKDYEQMARFFAPLRKESLAGSVRVTDSADRPGGEKPRFLTGSTPVTARWREELGFFVVRSRPFGRAFANRLWYHFMGRGIVDPPDDFNLKNKPSVPELLDYLSAEAAKEGWDLRSSIRRICSSDAYRRSSARAPRDPRAEAVFAVRTLKPLAPEQLVDSLAAALDLPELRQKRAVLLRALTGRSFGEDFSLTWRDRETVQDLMAKLTLDLRAPEAPVDELYLRLLSRAPSARERELCRGRDAAEIVFALAHSNEFHFSR
jgi:hypothetical protein